MRSILCSHRFGPVSLLFLPNWVVSLRGTVFTGNRTAIRNQHGSDRIGFRGGSGKIVCYFNSVFSAPCFCFWDDAHGSFFFLQIANKEQNHVLAITYHS